MPYTLHLTQRQFDQAVEDSKRRNEAKRKRDLAELAATKKRLTELGFLCPECQLPNHGKRPCGEDPFHVILDEAPDY